MTRRMIWPLLFGIAGVAVLVSLGIWQVQRLAWKNEMLAGIASRIGDRPVSLPPAPTETEHQNLPVSVEGHIGADALRVLASTKRLGAGHRLIVPLTLDDGRRVLVDLGLATGEFHGDRPACAGPLDRHRQPPLAGRD